MSKASDCPHVLMYHPVSAPFHWPQVPCRSAWIRVMPSTCRRSDDESCTKIPFLLFSINRSDVVDNCNIYHTSIYLSDNDSLYSLYTWGSLVCGSHVMIMLIGPGEEKEHFHHFLNHHIVMNTWSSQSTSLRLQWITNGIHLGRVVPGHRQNKYIYIIHIYTSFKCIMRTAVLMTLLLVILM